MYSNPNRAGPSSCGTLDGDLDRAIELANAAVELSPKNPEIRETRGQILMKMEAWQDAVVDLEFAVEAIPARAKIHKTLHRHVVTPKNALAELVDLRLEVGILAIQYPVL